MNDDILYIEQFLGGNVSGFESLVRRYQDRVLNIVYSLIGSDHESEDIAQEVFLKVYHNLRSFRQSSEFSTWLYRITVNTTTSFLRKRKKFVRDEGILESTPSDNKNPKDVLLIKEKTEMVERALKKIPVKFRTAMVLKDIEGLSYLDISKVLRCSIGTVESKIYRARLCLKVELTRLGGGVL